MGGSRDGCPGGVHTDLEKYESRIRKRWTKRATEKNGRIIGTGYADRQIKKSLEMAGKIDTRL